MVHHGMHNYYYEMFMSWRIGDHLLASIIYTYLLGQNSVIYSSYRTVITSSKNYVRTQVNVTSLTQPNKTQIYKWICFDMIHTAMVL